MSKQVQVVPVVSIVNNQAITTSRDVAEVFGKLHKDVLKAIRNLEIPDDFHGRNFAPNKINVLNNPSGEEISHYDITRDGFTILAMGFTGSKAMQFKIAYIEAFNKMEAALMKKHFPELPPPTLTPDQQRKVQQLIGEKVYATENKAMYPTYFKHVYRSIKDKFQVGKYDQVPATQFGELEAYVHKIDVGEKAKAIPLDERAILHARDIFFMAECIDDELMKASSSLFMAQRHLGRLLQDACILSPEVFDETKRRFRLEEKNLGSK